MFRKLFSPVSYIFSQDVPFKKRLFATLLPLVAVITLVSLGIDSRTEDRKFVPIQLKEMPTYDSAETQVVPEGLDSAPDYSYTIQKGDNLSSIFDQLGFPYSDLLKVMEADLNYLMLDTLKPGNQLLFWGTEGQNHLSKMILQFNIADKVLYTRHEDESYQFKDISVPGEWKLEPYVGEIHGSFSQSANKVGVGNNEIEQINTLLKDKLNFSRDLRAGDQFEIVQNRQYVGDQTTGKKEVQAIRIHNRGRTVTAFLHTDGQYYDKDGKSLQRAFQRYPTGKRYRISSSFNPNRKHPVTGRTSPHNGTDFATPIGTPVYSTGDGKVILTRNHPYAGKYIVIQHGSSYKTRYLHLSRILVKKGQAISRGQKIALSGNTGRSTGPHLHYEFMIRNKAVNAMKAKIPMASSVPKKEMAEFKVRIAEYNELLGQQFLVSTIK
ncbi:peptidoglycan DD-metalloendopeptidase family protein [Vibrio sp. DW001]|uniref:peptidoglycan DD-metalloendopeptidase family protein n=1 Tax=Vibrio sp. DW001 TaxID=2912315 RepID=UPI0023AFB5D4|nr:peptidoglycan DD-metalloendopeptidase family protein [Vibrio sp. DW001]